jgi:putative Mg2+ transporter-C (MgtC) family protein
MSRRGAAPWGCSREAEPYLRRLDSSNIEDSDRVEVLAVMSADRRSDGVLEQVAGRLSLEPSVTAARWRIEAVTE